MANSMINDLILDYLTMEGYTLAAARFSKEANLPQQQEPSAIKARQDIINLIHAGRIERAIELLNDLDPEVSLCYILPPLVPEQGVSPCRPSMIRTRVSHAPRIRHLPLMRHNHLSK
jgi:hypothetical protein